MLDFFYCYAALLCACIWLCPIALCIKVCINIAFLYSSNLKLGSTLFQCSLSSYLAFPKCTGWESGQEGDVTLFRTTGNVMAGKMLHLNTLNQSTVCVWFLVLDCLWSAQKEIGISIFQMAAFIVHVCCGGFFFSLILFMHETNCQVLDILLWFVLSWNIDDCSWLGKLWFIWWFVNVMFIFVPVLKVLLNWVNFVLQHWRRITAAT